MRVELEAAANGHVLAAVAAHSRDRFEQHEVLLRVCENVVGRAFRVLLFLNDAARCHLLADIGGLVSGELRQRDLIASASGEQEQQRSERQNQQAARCEGARGQSE